MPNKSKLLSPITATIIISVWISILTFVFIEFGFFKSDFFHFGPSETVYFLNKKINTWELWSVVVVYTIINQIITTYSLETITPWIINEVQAPGAYLTIDKRSVLTITTIWYLFMWLSRILGIQILLSQIDFMIVIGCTDIVTNFIVIKHYIKDKQVV